MRKISKVNVKSEVIAQGNKMFGVVFEKKNGQDRKMSARLGVKKHLAGGTNKVEASDRSYLTVFDMNAEGYRTVNLDTLKEVQIAGTRYEVV